MVDDISQRPIIRLQPGRHERVSLGYPWVYSNEIDAHNLPSGLTPGQLVNVHTHYGDAVGVAYYNPHTLIAARMLDRKAATVIDAGFLTRRIQRALNLRDMLFDQPFYRLVHAESDGLPGMIIDRYGDVYSVQISTQGAMQMVDDLLAALTSIDKRAKIVVRVPHAGEKYEKLSTEFSRCVGTIDAPVQIVENGVPYLADVLDGQKTGWFCDQRPNRKFMMSLAKDRSVLDLFTHTGGFGLAMLAAGAKSALLVDESKSALELARASAALNAKATEDKIETVAADVFDWLEAQSAGATYDCVVVDPPAFIKSKKDFAVGSKAYRKVTRMAAERVVSGGFMMVASCSYHIDAPTFLEQVRMGLSKAKRTGRMIYQGGAGPDHPVHWFLPESGYLKALVFQLD